MQENAFSSVNAGGKDDTSVTYIDTTIIYSLLESVFLIKCMRLK